MKKAWKFIFALVTALNIPVWSYFWRTKYAVWLGVSLSLFLSLPLLLWFVKYGIYQKVEKILKEDGVNNSYLEQLCKLSEKFWWSSVCVRKALVQIAGSKDESIECIMRAIDGLSISGYQAIEPLSDVLRHAIDSRMRSAAAQGLSKFQIPEIEDVLIKAAFKDNNPGVVKAAISGLINFPDSLPYLYRFIYHDDHYIRRTAMETIREIMKVPVIEAIPPVRNVLLNETENEVSNIAIDILRQIGGKDALLALQIVHKKWLTVDKLTTSGTVKKITDTIAKLEETTRREK